MTHISVSRPAHIQRLRPDSTSLVESWLELHRSVERADTVPAPEGCPKDLVASMSFAPPGMSLTDWVAVSAGVVVGWVRLATQDVTGDRSTMWVSGLMVHPDFRDNGIATQLMCWSLTEAGASGAAEIRGSFRAASDTAGAPAARRLIAELPGAEYVAFGRNQLLEVTDDLPAAVLPDGHHFVRWGSVIPDEYVVAASALEAGAGLGPLPTPDECADPEHRQSCYLRRFEVMRLGRSRRAYQTGVLDGAGRLVGFSSMSMTESEPRYALQGMTVVHHESRGLGLGLALKLANLAYARETEPDLRFLTTGNESTNAAMIAVNRAMGFRIVESEVFWRAPLSDHAE